MDVGDRLESSSLNTKQRSATQSRNVAPCSKAVYACQRPQQQKDNNMSKTTDAAIDHQNYMQAMEEIDAERNELAAMEWIAKNPNKAMAVAIIVKNGLHA